MSPRYAHRRNPPGSRTRCDKQHRSAARELLAELVNVAPPMPGGEYLNAAVLAALWEKIDTACRAEFAAAKQTLQEF